MARAGQRHSDEARQGKGVASQSDGRRRKLANRKFRPETAPILVPRGRDRANSRSMGYTEVRGRRLGPEIALVGGPALTGAYPLPPEGWSILRSTLKRKR